MRQTRLELHEYNKKINIPIGKYRSVRMLGMDNESVKNMPKACKNIVQMQGNSWLFLTICDFFLSRIRFTSHLPALALFQK